MEYCSTQHWTKNSQEVTRKKRINNMQVSISIEKHMREREREREKILDILSRIYIIFSSKAILIYMSIFVNVNTHGIEK